MELMGAVSVKKSKFLWIKVLLGVLVFQFFFLGAFSISEKKVAVKKKEEVSKIEIVPSDTSKLKEVEEEKARLEYDDPTIFSFPNLKHGFSSIRSGEWKPPVPDLPKFENSPILMKEKKEGPLPIKLKPPEIALAVADDWKLYKNTYTIEEFKEEKSPSPKEIVWMINGKEAAAPMEREEALKKIKVNSNTRKTTIFLLFENGKFATSIYSTSGDRKLDLYLLSKVNSYALKKFLNYKNSTHKEIISINWQQFTK